MTARTATIQFCLLIKMLIVGWLLKNCSLTKANMLRTPVSLTTEDLRFAVIRCQNDSHMASSLLKIKWAQRVYPDNNLTHCYIKCFLSRLGLIDLNNRGLNWNKLYSFWQSIDENFDDKCLEDSNINKELDGTCYSYYKTWLLLWENCEPLMRYIVINKSKIRSKALGVTASEFCDSLTKENDAASEISSNSRDTPASFMDLYKCNLECIFRHFHYFDAYGRIDEAEIVHSLGEAHALTPKNIAAVRICSHRANSLFNFGYCEMAFELKKCLTKRSTEFFNIYRVRDRITQYY